MDHTSESLPDPADEVPPQGQLLQTLEPGLVHILQPFLCVDQLQADLVQFFVTEVLEIFSLQDKALL